MRCRSCEYPLWNLKARECPECGEAFRPGEYDFVPNSVRFCCPYCDQPYYGTGEKGHLVPHAFQCAQCGRAVDMDEMVLRPAEGVSETETRTDRMPWFERQEIGLTRAWFATIWAAMIRPQSLIRAVPEETEPFRAWRFMFLTNLLFLAGGVGVPGLIVVVAFRVIGASGVATGGPAMGGFIMLQLVLQFGLSILLLATMPVLWAWLTHVLIRMTGETTASLRRTTHAIYYSSAANGLSAVPCGDCFRLVGSIWWLVSAILCVTEVHKCHGGRATFAVITAGVPVLVLQVILFIVASLAPLGLIPGIMGMGGGFNILGQQASTQSVVQAVTRYARQGDGAGPGHAAQLIVSNDLVSGSFVHIDTMTDETLVPVGETTLDQIPLLPPNRRKMAVDEAAAMLPAKVVAHRLGDFVFTYHGMDLSQPDGRMWAVVLIPDPDVNGPPAPADKVCVGFADDTVRETTYAELQGQLGAQNTLRAELGLPPLPDPVEVTHGTPAVAPDTD